MTGILTPADEEGVQEAIVAARGLGEPLALCGSGSKAAMLRPVQAGRTLSLARLKGIGFYSPEELVICARPGMVLAEIEKTLAERGQHLIAEPPHLQALFGQGPGTLGGTVAAGLSGPRRVALGAMRDHVIGLRAVNGRGEIIRSGGRVLKNVTGLDLCKLLTGSHGTLAAITEVTMKVLPAPEQSASLLLVGLDARKGVAVLAAGLGSPFGVSGAAFLPAEAAGRLMGPLRPGASATLLRIENFASFVAYRIERLRAELKRFGAAEVIGDAISRELWRAIRDGLPLAAGLEEALWRVAVRPTAGVEILMRAEAVGARGYLDWGGGLAWLAGPAETKTHAEITAAAAEAGGSWLLLRAPDGLRAAVAVVPPEKGPMAEIARRVKAAFDPDGILNPGRMRAGL